MIESNRLYLNVKNNFDSLHHIKTHKASVARFGDGEIDIIAGHNIPYQTYDKALADTLKEILALQSNENFLVCLPDAFEKTERYNAHARSFWEGHFNHYHQLYQDVCTADWYGSTFLSRPYIDLEDKTSAKAYFTQLIDLWTDRDVLIVEGKTSRSGVGNDLFDNAKSVQRIICPSHNAYGLLPHIEDAIRQHGKDKLILLMLGPTAKAISYHLHKEGYWTVDLGHIDSEYEWYKMGANHKVKLNHKHTAEHNMDLNIEFLDDEQYNQQIIATIDENTIREKIMHDTLASMTELSADSQDVLKDRELDLISFIVPIYNVEDYLEQCINSILNQTYTHIEILLINDGSTDRSKGICLEYAKKDSRIRLINKSNGGLSDARNFGIENANGTYLTFIDSDDFVDTKYAERLYVEAIRNNTKVVVSDYNKLNAENATFYFHTQKPYTKEVTPTDYFDEIFKTETLAFVVAWGKLIATELFNGDFPIRFPVGRLAEDKYVTHLLAWKAQRITYIHEPNYTYRIRPGSITTSQASLKRSDDDIRGCEERMLDLILMGYDLGGAIGWYQYILEIHQRHLEHNGHTNTDLYQKIKKKLALITNTYK